MAEATKHNNLPINGGTLISDMKSLFSIIKTRRTVAFAYGFMFAFVAFTVFLAFNPNPNSGAPWFTNIFSTSSTATTSGSGSQFSSFFSSFFYPNASSSSPSSSSQQFQSFVPSPQTQPSRSSNTTVNKQPPSQTQPIVNSDKPQVLSPNQTSDSPSNASLATQDSSSLPKQTLVKNQTQTAPNSDKATVLEANQTTIAAPITPVPVPVPANKTTSSPPKSGSSGKNDPKSVAEKGVTSNYTDVLKKQSNETKSSVSVKEGKDDLIKSLLSCDLFHGEWVEDDSYPLYEPGSCPLIDEQFNCIRNGRPDKDYQKFKWQPKDCNLPRLDGSHMLELLRGKRLVFVGDSLNRNMWESLVCILRNSAKDKSKVYEAHGRTHFRGEASYSFIFKDYNCTVEFFVSPFLVREWEMPDKDGSKKETLRLDLVGRSSNLYKDADILIFNTGHWWTHDKTAKGKDYYQEGSHVYGELNVLEAFRKALTTWSRWVDASVDTGKRMVFFRGYSASHFSGGQWNSGGQCDSETLPIFNETYLRPYPPKMLVLEKVLKNMKHHITYLNITRLTDFRKDGHPSIYRKQNLSPAERKSPKSFQDCSHWCLPGVPDAWNEVLYAELLVKLHKKNLHQQLQQQKKRALVKVTRA